MQKLIYVVEDEPEIQELIEFILFKEEYKFKSFLTGEAALNDIEKDLPDLIIIDLMLPGISGLELCKTIKNNNKTKNIPAIILTSRNDEFDVLTGFNLGCDDYITKPFSLKILLARIKNILKKSNIDTDDRKIIKAYNLLIDTEKLEVSNKGKIINLTTLEFKVLDLLARHPGKVFTRDNIFNEIKDGYTDSSERSIDVTINRIRKKLGSCSRYIQSVYGAGYRFIESLDNPNNE